MPMQSLRNIENNTPATATDVQWNFGTLESFVNNNLLNIDGSISMTGQLTLAGNPLSDLHAVTKQYVDAIQPTGMIVDYAGATAPSGWLICDGSIVNQSSYPALYAVCGSTYNTGGEGGTQFRLPDFRSRSSVHPGGSPIGTTGGVADAVVVSHDHTASGGSHSHTGAAHTHSLSNHTHTSAAHSHSISSHSHSSAAHSHTSAAHTHSITHNHASFNTASGGSHVHNGIYDPYTGREYGMQFNGGIGSGADYLSADSGSNIQQQVGSNNSSHAHAIDVPNYSGNSGSTTPGSTGSTTPGSTGGKSLTSNSTTPGSTGNPSANTTGAQTSANTGSVDVTPTISTEGQSGTAMNYHPFLIVNKIIKAG